MTRARPWCHEAPGGGDAGGGAQQGTASRHRKRKFNIAFWAREPGKYSRVIPGTGGPWREGDGPGEELGRLVVSCFSHQTASLRARRDLATQGIDLIPSQPALLALYRLAPWSQPAKEYPDGAHVSSGVRAPEAGGFLGILRLRRFLNPESGFPGPENELGAGATLREAKGIVGTLCKNRTPNRRIFLSPRASPARGALSFCYGNIPGRETTRRLRAPAPSATDPSDLWKDGQLQSQPEEPEPTLDGAAARAFYEALIEDESSTPETQRAQPGPGSERKRKKRRMMRETAAGASGGHGQRRSLEAKDKMTQQILRAAQEGDLAKLKRLLDPHEAGGAGGNINARDAFWWTPLMCAARAGQGEAVRYLLGRGAAWVGVCELGGRDAAQLAEEAGFPEVARMVRESPGERRSPENRSRSPSPQYCETCDAHFQDSNHCTSTAHLLSLSRDLRPPILPVGVPTSSPGFKLLLRGGWEPGMGLGPRGEGRANPIPTVLKRDQEGLGYRSAPQPRVTHFPARDTRAVAGRERAPRVTTLNRKEEKRQEEKDKAWERDLRTYMNLEF